ncbi:ANTAR domain-containing protein [Nocardioides KLBMP 9356]|uniref:ANTAR domain-containing protein n=1 Tax=Nocardioides potassii TaxID=2911371 RepID=A0ABS9HG26_9ACTN|nr:ANTAR domain-containing protein [Nocardioides potassii]MCF6379317.1 ANTAR domain-containing protein [Nocardioides potassii]
MSDLKRQIDELAAALASSRADIADLTERADVSHARPDAAETRADAMEHRVDGIEVRADVDREIVAELQADGGLARENVEQLQTALMSSRVVGTALGILMTSRNVSQVEALTVLKDARQRTNTKLRDLAATIVAGAEAVR